jgi:hypothetical protein
MQLLRDNLVSVTHGPSIAGRLIGRYRPSGHPLKRPPLPSSSRPPLRSPPPRRPRRLPLPPPRRPRLRFPNSLGW